MNRTRGWHWAAAVPVVVFLLAYAQLGWLDPAHWLDEPKLNAPPPSAALGQRLRSTHPRPAPPWPDEPAMRLQLSGRGLRLMAFQLGSQRMGATEVRVTLQWQGALGASLEMLQALALDMPQMALDALVLQALSPTEWRVIWRGQWRDLPVPRPLPQRPQPLDGLAAQARARPFDPASLRQQLARLWPQGQPSDAVLRLVRPEDLVLVAVLRRPEPMAWLHWQQHTLVVRVGDRIGAAGARVQSIGPDQVIIVQAGRTHRLFPAALGVSSGEAP